MKAFCNQPMLPAFRTQTHRGPDQSPWL
uniref:Uncharacterized protein n=1 Tax=Anguilla anguilla TaxID=7936 RepID=A0A0E9TM31_ANGAN